MLLRSTKVLTILMLLTACSPEVPSASQPAAPLKRDESVQLTRAVEGHTGTLEWRPGPGLIALRVAGAPPSATQLDTAARVALWTPLVQQLLDTQGRRPTYLLAVGDYPEFGNRLAAGVACSGKWDLTAGRPVASAPDIVRQTMDDPGVFREVSALGAKLGYSVAVHTAENVVLCQWSSVRDAASGCRQPIAASARVPCGASVVFKLTSRPQGD